MVRALVLLLLATALSSCCASTSRRDLSIKKTEGSGCQLDVCTKTCESAVDLCHSGGGGASCDADYQACMTNCAQKCS